MRLQLACSVVSLASAAYPQLALPSPWDLQQQLALPNPSWGLQGPPGPVVAGFAAAGVADDGPVGPQLALPPPHPIAHAKLPPPGPPFSPENPPPPPPPLPPPSPNEDPPGAGPVVNEDPPDPPQNTHAERLDMMEGRMLRLDHLVCLLVQANMNLAEQVLNIEQRLHQQIAALAVGPPSVPAGVLGASDAGTLAAVAPEPAAAPSSSSQPQWQSQQWGGRDDDEWDEWDEWAWGGDTWLSQSAWGGYTGQPLGGRDDVDDGAASPCMQT